jgi:D-sedoheptulose 7-phosphate isomerase
MKALSSPTFFEKNSTLARNFIRDPQSYTKVLTEVLVNLDFSKIEAIARLIADVGQRQAQLLIAGNGGSASNASHYRCDLINAFRTYQSRLQILNLSESPSMITALGNDFDFTNIFSLQVRETGNLDDVLLLLTASGNSQNILKACEAAKKKGIKTISITGFDGGKVALVADINFTIPSNNYGVIEDVQLVLGHMFSQTICGLIEDSLVEEKS